MPAGFSSAPRCLIRRWGELDEWAVDYDMGPSGQGSLPTVRLSTLLKPVVVPVASDERKFDTLQVIEKITFGGRIQIRSAEKLIAYKGPLFRAAPGQLIVSKIRVLQGSLAVVSEEIGEVAVSPEYPTFEIDTSLVDRRFLELSLRSPAALAQLRPTGNTTKQRVPPTKFLTARIPCPDLDAQRSLIAAYDAKVTEAAKLEAEASELEAGALREFEAALGIVPPPPLPDRPMFIASFSDISRWSHEAVLRRITGTEPPPSPYPIVALEDVIADLENGWSPQCLKRPAEGEEWGVVKVGAVSSGVYNPGQNKALPGSLTPKPALEVRQGDLLIGRANIARLVGATAYVDATPPRLILCDKIFRAIPLPASPVRFDFLAAVLKTPSVREQIEGQLTGSSPTMKNISKPALLGLTFPMPTDLSVQADLMADLNAAQAAAADMRTAAQSIRHDAWRAFETAIYGDASELPQIDDFDDAEAMDFEEA